MSFLKTTLLPIFAGFVVAAIAMMLFEYANSFFYPLPEGLDIMNTAAVQAFTASLPWTAYILVMLGYIVGAFCGGYVTTLFSAASAFRATITLGIVLTIAALINVLTIGHPLIFDILALPQFIIWTYLGHLYLRSSRSKNVVGSELITH